MLNIGKFWGIVWSGFVYFWSRVAGFLWTSVFLLGPDSLLYLGPWFLLLPISYLYGMIFSFFGNVFVIKQKGSSGIYNLWLSVSRKHHLISVERP